jgi:radical SAM protein with 4Fe4S-binding SPASM domain
MTAMLHEWKEHDGRRMRLHLREEPDGSGILLVNATSGARLSATAMVMARALLARGGDAFEVVSRRFPGVPTAQLRADLERVRTLVDRLLSGTARHPLTSVDELGAPARLHELGAPLCADVVVDGGHDVRAWLGQLWEIGVPQVVLVPSTKHAVRPLVELVERAEDLGLVCGVRSPASWIDDAVLDAMARAGLDYLEVPWAGSAHGAWFPAGDEARAEAVIARGRSLEVCVTACIPLARANVDDLDDMLGDLARLGIADVTVFAIATTDAEDADALPAMALPQAAAWCEAGCERLRLGLVWAPPVERDPKLAIAEVALAGPRGAGEATIAIAADGTLRPPVGPPVDDPGARIGGEDWARRFGTMWSSAPWVAWRHGAAQARRCATCPELGSCKHGCPRDRASWSQREEGGR